MIDTSGSMTAAYVVATVIYVAYISSLWMRARKLRVAIDDAARRDGVDATGTPR